MSEKEEVTKRKENVVPDGLPIVEIMQETAGPNEIASEREPTIMIDDKNDSKESISPLKQSVA